MFKQQNSQIVNCKSKRSQVLDLSIHEFTLMISFIRVHERLVSIPALPARCRQASVTLAD